VSVIIMLRAMFGSVKYIRGSVSKHSVFVSEVVSNVRQISTARTVFNKVSDDVPKGLATFCYRYYQGC